MSRDVETEGGGANVDANARSGAAAGELQLGRRARAPRVLAWAWIACAAGLALAPVLPSPQLAWAFAVAPLLAWIRRARPEARFVLRAEQLGIWQDGRRVFVPWSAMRGPLRERRELFVDYLQVERHDAPLLLLCLGGLREEERRALRERCAAALEGAARRDEANAPRAIQQELENVDSLARVPARRGAELDPRAHAQGKRTSPRR